MFTMSRLIKEERETEREEKEGRMQIFATFLAFDQVCMATVWDVFVVSAEYKR